MLPIPGFGPDVSAEVFAVIGNPFGFKTGRQVLKPVGIFLMRSKDTLCISRLIVNQSLAVKYLSFLSYFSLWPQKGYIVAQSEFPSLFR